MLIGILLIAGCVAEGEAADTGDQPIDPNTLPPPTAGAARILGTVTDDALAPLDGAQVGVLGSDPPLVASTNSAGQFVLDILQPGRLSISVQKLGYQTAGQSVDVAEGEQKEINFVLSPIAVAGESRFVTIIGDGYFACGADTPVVTWGNLHACVWDEHHPNVTFDVAKQDFSGVMDEVVWQQSSGLTSQSLSVSIAYHQVCDPFCATSEQWGADYGDDVSPSPVRFFASFDEKEMAKVPEDPMPLKSVTFPDRDEQPFVVVFQQRMTHYITMFYGEVDEENILDQFSAMPDA